MDKGLRKEMSIFFIGVFIFFGFFFIMMKVEDKCFKHTMPIYRCHVDLIDITPDRDRLKNDRENRENKAAFERVQDGKDKPGDRDKAERYFSENFS